MNKPENVLIVGGGISGLATASYLSKFGLKVTVLEKEKIVGGYFRSFKANGFFFDAGIRAVENSGIIIPFLKELGIFEEVDLKKTLSLSVSLTTFLIFPILVVLKVIVRLLKNILKITQKK